MDTLNFTRPVDDQYAHVGLETALVQAFHQVYVEQFSQKMQDLVDYGAAHIGSRTVIERFSKQDGLVVLRRPVTSDTLMRVIYANWSSLASERGLGFLEFVLKMIWANQWQIIRLWHSVARINQYPLFLSTEQQANYFLTSRIMISLDATVSIAEIAELSPIIRRLVPANIVVKVNAKALNREAETKAIGVAMVGKVYNLVDLS